MYVYQHNLSDFIDGAINSDRLLAEIKAVPALVDCAWIQLQAPHVLVAYPTALSSGDHALLDATVLAHRDALHWLPDVKRAKFKAIDDKTISMIEAGFTYNGIVYELYLEAQVRLLGMIVMAQYLTYPILYNSKDDNSVLQLNGAQDIMALAGTALASIGWILNSGTSQKQRVRDATTVEQVNAIVDPR